MPQYKVILLVPVSAEVEAETPKAASHEVITSLQRQYKDIRVYPLLHSTEELGDDNDNHS